MAKDVSKFPVFSLSRPIVKTQASVEQAKKAAEMQYRNKKPQFTPTNRPDLRIKSTFNKMMAGVFGKDSPEAHFFNVVESKPKFTGKHASGKNKNVSRMWIPKQPWKKRGAKKVDKFAAQKLALKKWGLIKRTAPRDFNTYLAAHKSLAAIYKPARITDSSVLNFQHFFMPNSADLSSLAPQLGARFIEPVMHSGFVANMLQKRGGDAGLQKRSLTTYDKVFYYYTLQTPLNMYAHKAFILLEMQLNATLVRAKLVPYLFMVRDLCFYRLVMLNGAVAKNPHQVVSLYDAVQIPVYLHNYMYYRQYRIQYYPKNIGLFFKNYWAHFTNYTNNKVWLLSNFVTSEVTAEAIIFDYPNITLYMGPFKRFTKLYYKNHPYAAKGKLRYLNHTHTVLKLKLFEYAAFYR